jgi:hypothetical protein
MPFCFVLNYRNRFKGLLLSFVYILEHLRLQIRRLSNLVGLLISGYRSGSSHKRLANNVLEPGGVLQNSCWKYLPHIFRQELYHHSSLSRQSIRVDVIQNRVSQYIKNSSSIICASTTCDPGTSHAVTFSAFVALTIDEKL